MGAFNPDLYGVFAAISIGSLPYEGEDIQRDGGRTLTLMERPGGPDDPYGGFKQVDLIHRADGVELPEGVEDDPERGTSVGYEDDFAYEVRLVDGVAKIERAGEIAG